MTHSTRRRKALMGLGVVTVSGAVVFGLQSATLGGNGQGNNGNGGGNTTGSPGQALAATVQAVTPLAPGRQATVTVRVHNPNNQAVILTGLSGRITGVTSGNLPAPIPACDPTWFQVGTWQGTLRIAANSAGLASMPVTFDNKPTTNQDNCKGVTYRYSFTATGRQS